MSAPPFILLYTDESQDIMDDLLTRPRDVKTKKVQKALRLLREPHALCLAHLVGVRT